MKGNADVSNTGPEWEAFSEALPAVDALHIALSPLRRDEERTVPALTQALTHLGTKDSALLILATLDTDMTEALIGPLLTVALRGRDTLRVRQLLGRLPHDTAETLVPPAVWKLLESTDDPDDYRRMAELLDHLGLKETLRELCARARDSIDEEIREVAEDFQAE